MNFSKRVKRSSKPDAQSTQFHILFAISLVHLFNDSFQAIVPAVLPILKENMALSFLQAGTIYFTLNMTSSLFQPAIGYFADRRSLPFMLPAGMVLSFLGILGLGLSPNYFFTILSVFLLGLGSAVFHPESSRVSFYAGGKKRGLAQSIFQVGGNVGQSLASLMTILIFVPLGQSGALWFLFIAGAAILIQFYVAKWYQSYISEHMVFSKNTVSQKMSMKKTKMVRMALVLLLCLIFVRTWYQSAVTVYYPFQLMEDFDLRLSQAQLYIFLFTAAGAAGTFFGGPLSDKFGRKSVIFISMIGSAPFALMLPYADPFWASIILVFNGFIIMSGWSVTVVYAQELFPGKIGTIAGLTTGLSFGLGGIGAVALGGLIDTYSLSTVLKFISFLPLLGLLTYFLPSNRKIEETA